MGKNKITHQKTKKTTKYRMKLIDSCKFMSTSPPNLTDNLSEKLYQRRCINYKYFPQDEKVKGDLFIYNC